MSWLIGLIGFAVGLLVGALVYKQLKSDEARVRMLEEQLEDLQREHEAYKDSVHTHFHDTASLLNNLTESYRDVYRHMASGAQALCPEYISEQLSHSARAQESLTRDTFMGEQNAQAELSPPRDYADRQGSDHKGSLSEDYGLDKVTESEVREPQY